MNNVFLIGRTTKDIELKRTQSGKAVTTFSLAVDRRKKEEGADFPVCVAWGKIAELLDAFVKKGNKIGVIGRLQTRNYESKCQKHFVTEVVVDEIEFLEKKAVSVFSEYKREAPDSVSELPY